MTLWNIHTNSASTGQAAYGHGKGYATPAEAHAVCIKLGVNCKAVVCSSSNNSCQLYDSASKVQSKAN